MLRPKFSIYTTPLRLTESMQKECEPQDREKDCEMPSPRHGAANEGMDSEAAGDCTTLSSSTVNHGWVRAYRALCSLFNYELLSDSAVGTSIICTRRGDHQGFNG